MVNVVNVIAELANSKRCVTEGPVKPVVIQFPVNDICNAGCLMCNIWKNKLDYQISPEELGKALENELYSDVKSVGLNGGEPTLRKDLPELTEVLFQKLPKLKNISLITNAFVSKKVIQKIEELGEIVRRYKGRFDVMVSLDGVGEVHDLVRGRKRNYENADKVIDFILSSDLVDSKRLGCTVIKDNVYDVENLFDYAMRKNIYVKYRLGIPHQRLYVDKENEHFMLNRNEIYHFSVFLENIIKYYEKNEQQRYFYRSLIDQLVHNSPRKAKCDWQYRGATISSRGELLYCAVESNVLGKITEENSYDLYFDNKQHLEEIVENKCSGCNHDYMGSLPYGELKRFYVNKALGKFGMTTNSIKEVRLFKPLKKIRHRRLLDKRAIKYNLNSNVSLNQAISIKSPKANQKKILIIGWYGTETQGDKAILGGIVSSLEKIFENPEIHVMSIEKYITEITIGQMPELNNVNILSIDEAIVEVDTMELVVFGGGPIMAIDQMVEMVRIFELAVANDIPTILAGCGLGPFGEDYHNKLIKRILELSKYKIFRDERSYNYFLSMGIDKNNSYVSEDPAFTWLGRKNRKAERIESTKFKVLLGLRSWPYVQYSNDISRAEGDVVIEQFENEFIHAMEEIVKIAPNVLIVPYPMCSNHFGDDDRWYYRKLFRSQNKLAGHLDYNYLSKEVDPEQAFALYQQCDFIISMRFHSLVFALSSGNSVIAIDYTLGRGKVASLAEKFSVPYVSYKGFKSEFIVEEFKKVFKLDQKNRGNTYSNYTLTFENCMRSALLS